MKYPFRTLGSAALAAMLPCAAFGAAPVIENPGPLDPANPTAPLKIPAAKTLVVPLSVVGGDGPLNYTVKSSHPKVFARVRTGNPIMRVHVSYAGATPLPAGSSMDFVLFREATPVTAKTIAGLAQKGFYDGLIFHRIIPGFVAQGGDPAGTGSGRVNGTGPFIGLPFEFQHEFRPELIFSGRGQLAMANSAGGYDRGATTIFGTIASLGDFSATNGSQFFITLNQLRAPSPTINVNLDFKHTIFGQLIRGFDVLDAIAAVPKDANDKPTSPVTMTSVEILPGDSGAYLMLSSKAPADARVTVTVADGVNPAVTKQLTVQSVRDTVNDPPIIDPIAPGSVDPGEPFDLQVRVRDLEFDSLAIRQGKLDTSARADAAAIPISRPSPTVPILRFTAPATVGPFNIPIGVAGVNDPLFPLTSTSSNPFGEFDAFRWQVANISVGDKSAIGEAVTVPGTPGGALTGAVVARFTDTDPQAQTGAITATINWGDGSAPEAGTVAPDASQPALSRYQVTGTHTYARRGTYAVTVTVTSGKGTRLATIDSTAQISAGALRAAGERLDIKGRTVSNRVLATFTDAAPVPAAGYAATVDWGDGKRTRGTVRAVAGGKFTVSASHTYIDPATFPVEVRVRKTGTADDALAWSSVRVHSFAAAEVLPPFSQARLSLTLSPVPLFPSFPTFGSKPVKTTVGDPAGQSQTYLSYTLLMANTGNKTSKVGKLRIYLSKDTTLEPKTPSNPTGDVPVKIGNWTEATVPSLQPGAVMTYIFEDGEQGDFRLRPPANETATGLYVLASVEYGDPISAITPIAREGVQGRLNGVLVKINDVVAASPSVQTSEEGKNGKFQVVLDKKPAADVRVTLTVGDTTEGLIRRTGGEADDTLLLTFTPTNWSAAQEVEVLGLPDGTADGNQPYNITSVVSSTDPLFAGLAAPSVRVTNSEALVLVAPTFLTTTEAEGSTHTRTFTVKLSKAPAADKKVVVDLAVGDATEGSIDKTELTFTPANWAVAQTVTVTALNDDDVREPMPAGQVATAGSTTYTINLTLGAATSDAAYIGTQVNDVTVTNTDDTLRPTTP